MGLPHNPAQIYLWSGSAWVSALADAAGHFQVDVLSCANPSNLDAAISTLASQATLALIKAKTDNLPTDPSKESGKLTDIKAKTDNLDLAITALRDALRGTSSKTLTDLNTYLATLAGGVASTHFQVDVLTLPSGWTRMKTYTWVVTTPAVGGIPGPRISENQTVSRIDAYVTAATSATFNVEERSAIGSAGTNIMTTDLAADVTGEAQTVFANDSLAAGNWLWLDISAVSGTPGTLVVTVTVSVD